MHREYHRWHSPALGREMELLVFGHGGARVLVFPTSMGRFYEWEDRGMVAALLEPIASGHVQLYCVDSIDAESWYNRHVPAGEGAWRHLQYERYLLEEVLPFSWHRNATPFLIVTGTSFGAYHAVNIAFRHPQWFSRVIGLSGLYDIKGITRGHVDDNVYANDPSHYLLHLGRGPRYDALRRLDIVLAIGRDDPAFRDNEHLSAVLWTQDIWHAFRPWDGWAHDWPWWQHMIRRYIGGPD